MHYHNGLPGVLPVQVRTYPHCDSRLPSEAVNLPRQRRAVYYSQGLPTKCSRQLFNSFASFIRLEHHCALAYMFTAHSPGSATPTWPSLHLCSTSGSMMSSSNPRSGMQHASHSETFIAGAAATIFVLIRYNFGPFSAPCHHLDLYNAR